MPVEIPVAFAFAALIWTIAVMSRRRRLAVMARRAALLDACAPLFTDRLVRVSPMGFPRMAGTCGGLRWDVQLVPDALGVRKLPALWLMVSLTEAVPVAATLHLMLRPTGGEGFSRFRDLPEQVALPQDYPQDAGVRTDDAARMPSPALLVPVLALGQDRIKEIILSPKGLRVTLLAEEADRRNYLILRQTDLGQTAIDAGLVQAAMAAMLALRDKLPDQQTRKTA